MVGIDELIHLVEADAEVQGQLVGELPFILQVASKQPPSFDVLSSTLTGTSPTSGMSAEALLTSVCSPLMKKPARRICVSFDLVGPIALHAVDQTLALDVGRETVEDEVAELVGLEVEIAVAREVCKLPIDEVRILLQRDHVIVVLLELPFV